MDETVSHFKELFALLKTEFGIICRSAEPIQGGMNNRICGIKTQDGKRLVAKQYFVDDRRRLEREWVTLAALQEANFLHTPRPIARFDALSIGVYTHEDGIRMESALLTDTHLKTMASCLARLHEIRRASVRQPLNAAFMSAFSLADVIVLIQNRMIRITGALDNGTAARLHEFLHKTPALDMLNAAIHVFTETIGSKQLNRRLSDEDARLTSVDFGPHNMLWRSDGWLTLLDFEYGGFDHPLRVIGDMLAHEQLRGLSSAKKNSLLHAYLRETPLPQYILDDLPAYRRLAELEWITILMTSLLPDALERISHAKGPTYNIEAHIDGQLQKLRERLASFS